MGMSKEETKENARQQRRASLPGGRRGSFLNAMMDAFLKEDASKSSRWSQIKSDSQDMYNKGVKYEKKGDLSSAEFCFIRALNARAFSGGVNDIGVVIVHIKLALVLEKMGNVLDARAHYNSAYRTLKSYNLSDKMFEDFHISEFVVNSENLVRSKLMKLPSNMIVVHSDHAQKCILCSRRCAERRQSF